MSIDVAGWLGGQKVLSGGTVSDALGEGGWDWQVDLHPVSTRITKGGVDVKRRIDDAWAVVRMTDYKPLSVVGNFFRPIQHPEAFGVLDLLIAQGRANIVAGQSIRDGRKVVLVTELDEPLEVAGEPFLPLQVWMNGHDGRTPVAMFPVPTRLYCTNEFAALKALAGKRAGTYKLKHTKMAPFKLLQAQQEIFDVSSLDAELDKEFMDASGSEIRQMVRDERDLAADASEAMTKTLGYFESLERVGNDLASVKFSDRDFENFLKKLVPIRDEAPPRESTLREEKRAEIRLVYKQADDLNNIRGTAWGVLNAVLYRLLHRSPYRD